jgi:hypothetical protein
MSTKTRILVLAISTFAGLVVSLGVTMTAWSHFEDRAFHCTDRMSVFFWDSIETHRGAGDTVLPGWTWAQIKSTQKKYEIGFGALWVLIAAAPALALRRASHA